MSRFFKFLIMVAAIANLVLIFVYEGQIPGDFHIPFLGQMSENESKEPLVEETVLPVQTEEVAEPEIAEEEEVLPETPVAEVEVAEEPAEEAVEEEEPPVCRIISLDGSTVRSGPGPDYEVVTSYPYDTVLVLTGEPEIGWYPVLAEDGTEGFIFETQIELPEGYVTEETVY